MHHSFLLSRSVLGAFRRRQANTIEFVQKTGALPQLREAITEGTGQKGHKLLHLQRSGSH